MKADQLLCFFSEEELVRMFLKLRPPLSAGVAFAGVRFWEDTLYVYA